MFTQFARKTAFVSLAAAAAFVNVAVATPAQAEDYDGRSVTVRYSDLDLTSANGAARLERRIAHAANVVCGPVDQRSLTQMAQARTCRTGAIASAEPQVKLVLASVQQGTKLASAAAITVAAN